MVCINGCCSQFFSLANLVPTSPPIHPVPHHPSTQHSDANHLTSPLRAHPPPAFLSWHQLLAQPLERTQGEHTFCPYLTQSAQKSTRKAPDFQPTINHVPYRLRCCGSMSKFCTSQEHHFEGKHQMSTHVAPARSLARSTILKKKRIRWAQIAHQPGEPFWRKHARWVQQPWA